jgi:hypothetical protein
MMHTWRRLIAISVLAVGGASCGSSDTVDPIVADPGLTVAGLKFTLAGATLTAVNASLPTADASFAAPVVAINRPPTSTQSATITVSAAEPFQTVLVQPGGSSSYVRVFLPAQTTLIGVTVIANPAGSTSVATAATIAVANGARASRTSALLFQPISN